MAVFPWRNNEKQAIAGRGERNSHFSECGNVVIKASWVLELTSEQNGRLEQDFRGILQRFISLWYKAQTDGDREKECSRLSV